MFLFIRQKITCVPFTFSVFTLQFYSSEWHGLVFLRDTRCMCVAIDVWVELVLTSGGWVLITTCCVCVYIHTACSNQHRFSCVCSAGDEHCDSVSDKSTTDGRSTARVIHQSLHKVTVYNSHLQLPIHYKSLHKVTVYNSHSPVFAQGNCLRGSFTSLYTLCPVRGAVSGQWSICVQWGGLSVVSGQFVSVQWGGLSVVHDVSSEGVCRWSVLCPVSGQWSVDWRGWCLPCCWQVSAEMDSESSAVAAACSRLNTALTQSIMEFLLYDDTVDVDVLRRSLHHQVDSVTDRHWHLSHTSSRTVY